MRDAIIVSLFSHISGESFVSNVRLAIGVKCCSRTVSAKLSCNEECLCSSKTMPGDDEPIPRALFPCSGDECNHSAADIGPCEIVAVVTVTTLADSKARNEIQDVLTCCSDNICASKYEDDGFV